MTKFAKQLKEETHKIALTEVERAHLRKRVVMYMEYKPIRKAPALQRHAMPSLDVFGFFRAHHLTGALVIALLTSSFGMTFAAADALPGDLLYTVKVDVNEEVLGALFTGEDRKLAWEQERAERRLEEASRLAAEGRLDAERKAEVSRRFAEHTEAVVSKVREVEDEDPVLASEVTSDFEAALDSHEAVLARLIVEQDEVGSEDAKALVAEVKVVAQMVQELTDEAEARISEPTEEVATASGVLTADDTDATTSPDDTVKETSAILREEATYRVRERANEQKLIAETALVQLGGTHELFIQAQAQLDSGTDAYERGTVHVSEGDFNKAYREYRTASAIFQKVARMIEAANLFNISLIEDVADANDSQSVEEEDSENTQTERDVLVKERDALMARVGDVNGLLLAHEGMQVNVVARINGFVKDARAMVLRAEIAMVLEDYREASRLLDNADRISRNALALAQQEVESQEVADESAPDEVVAKEQPVTPPVLPEVPDLPRLDVVTVYHEYRDGTHTYSGVFYTPTSCFTLSADALVAESYPEQVTVRLVTREENKNCPFAIDRKAFSVEVQASEEANLLGVTVNGTESKFELAEGPNTAIFDDPVSVPVMQGAPAGVE